MKQPKLSDLEIDAKETQVIRNQLKKDKKVKMTINLDENILSAVKVEAQQSGVPYQHLVNRLLRQVLDQKQKDSNRLDKLEKELKDLKNKFTA